MSKTAVQKKTDYCFSLRGLRRPWGGGAWPPSPSLVTSLDVPISGEKPLDLASNLNSFYVYCDLLQPILVGDTKVPLLRIVDKSEKTEGTTYRTMNLVQYVPIQKKCFDTIQIKLATDAGVVVPFFPGKCVVVLEFRRTIHSYFLI